MFGRFRQIPLILFLLLGWNAASLFADDVTSVVGSEGAILRIHSGTYAELFADGAEASPDSLVLALDVLRPRSELRYLVPGTEDSYVESSATLYYEKTTDLTFVLWEGLLNGIHPLLKLATFDGASWGESLEILGGSFTAKKDPQLVIRSDDVIGFKRSSGLRDGSSRTAVFVVWSEDLGWVNRKRMVPIVFQGGSYSGLDIRLYLDDFLSKKTSEDSFVDADIREALRFQPSPHGATVGFLNEESNELVSMGVELLPLELSSLAGAVERYLQNVNPRLPLEVIVAQVRQVILTQGAGFSPGSLDYIADEVEALVRSELRDGQPDESALPDKARLSVVHIGAKIEPGGLVGDEVPHVVEIGAPTAEEPSSYVKISNLSRRPAPEVGGKASIFLSRTGHDILVAWQQDGFVYFLESEGQGWGERQEIELNDSLTRAEVYQLLADRILNR